MGLSIRTRGGATLAGTAALVLAGGAVGCGAGKGDGASGSERTVQQVLTVAYEKTAEAKSAKVEMTMSMPAAMDGGGEATMTGVMGWDPTVMDVTMKGSMLATEGGPEQVRMIWRDNVMYMDMGAESAKDMDGKRWMKLDLAAAAKASGDEAVTKQMTSGLENMNQNPAEQLAMLLESPNLKHVGSEKIDGAETEHYKGTLTVKEMMASNKNLEVLEPKDREKLLENIEKSGIKGYDTEVWVNEDDLPVRMDVGMETPQGNVDMSMKFSDYGAKAEVEVPPAGETFDLFEMLKDLEGMAGDESSLDGSGV
ncbi:putative lipoprotein [Streptomyces spinoverrucosus]|uniref:Putative lipoprotein n=1 Tax=Streptomyces spinoverrucosus TaxID=284043 RepID=A0A4Y3VGF5_9ACTN|nr:hypothetical protein [Streptomyces spinoverrucosus]GEC04870.1 putative lipoprotein [Streptomyces spinoverrucosus]GHB60282.1 putative lipoprotein [Streptomyces spinoverrucosus]